MTGPLSDEDAAKGGPEYIDKVQPALSYFGSHATGKSRRWLALAIVFALFYAVGTAGLASVIQFLSTIGDTRKTVPILVWVMLGAFCLRPVFYVCHIQSVARAVLGMSELSKYSRANGLILRSLIILTRDVPTLIILLGAILVLGRWMGAFIALLLLLGLIFVIPARLRAEKGKIAKKVTAAGNQTDVIQRRVARTWAEASTDVVIALLLIAIFGLYTLSDMTNFAALAAVVILGLLMLTPLRRISRLLVEYK